MDLALTWVNLKGEFVFSFFKGLFLNGEIIFLKQMFQTILLTVLSVWQVTKMVQETNNDGMSLALFYF